MSLTTLPTELLATIASHLSPKDIANMTQTSKRIEPSRPLLLNPLALHSKHSSTALYCAAVTANKELLRLLLENVATGLTIRRNGRPRKLCLGGEFLEERGVRALVEWVLRGRGEDVVVRDPDGAGDTPLHVAVKRRANTRLARLLAMGADAEVCDSRGRAALSAAVLEGDEAAVGILVRAGAGLETRDGGLLTPLHHAALSGRYAIALALLEAGAQVGARDLLGNTTVEVALFHRHADVAGVLLMKAGVGFRTRRGETAMHVAARCGYLGVVERLVFEGLVEGIDALDFKGFTPLHAAVVHNWVNIASLLLAEGADDNAKDDCGRIPIMYSRGKQMSAMFAKFLGRPVPEPDPLLDWRFGGR